MGDPSGVIHIPDVDPIELVVKENTGGTDKWSLASMGALQVPPMSTSDGLKGPKIPQNWPKVKNWNLFWKNMDIIGLKPT